MVDSDMTYNKLEPAARLTDNCGDGTLTCPVCWEGYLRPGKVTELQEGGVYIAFSCEHCTMPEMSLADTIGSLRILYHKGNTNLTWEVNPVFLNAERVREHETLVGQYYDTVRKINALRRGTDRKIAGERIEDVMRGWDE
jgi:hypothetical protein